jgi:hypothetical protein
MCSDSGLMVEGFGCGNHARSKITLAFGRDSERLSDPSYRRECAVKPLPDQDAKSRPSEVQCARLTLQELLLSNAPRAAIPIPKRGRLRRREPHGDAESV